MKVLDIFGTLHSGPDVQPLLQDQINRISEHCSQFLEESGGLPVYKNINKTRTFTKLKARVRKHNDGFSNTFNEVFAPKLRQRAIYAHGDRLSLCETEQAYYLFPINGFQYVYNTQIQDSSIYESVYHHLDSDDLFRELLERNYQNDRLVEGINSGAELLFHNIPYCYAVNVSAYSSYNQLLSCL